MASYWAGYRAPLHQSMAGWVYLPLPALVATANLEANAINCKYHPWLHILVASLILSHMA